MVTRDSRPKLWRTILLLAVILITLFGLYELGQEQEKRKTTNTSLVIEHPKPKEVDPPVVIQVLALAVLFVPITRYVWSNRHSLQAIKRR